MGRSIEPPNIGGLIQKQEVVNILNMYIEALNKEYQEHGISDDISAEHLLIEIKNLVEEIEEGYIAPPYIEANLHSRAKQKKEVNRVIVEEAIRYLNDMKNRPPYIDFYRYP